MTKDMLVLKIIVDMAGRYNESKAKEQPTAQQLMARAVARRDELDVFIRFLSETLSGRGLQDVQTAK